MSILIGKYEFDGPFPDEQSLKSQSGLFVVLEQGEQGSILLDVGESESVQEGVLAHARKPCWEAKRQRPLFFAALYTGRLDASQRRLIEQEIRAKYRPPCGEN